MIRVILTAQSTNVHVETWFQSVLIWHRQICSRCCLFRGVSCFIYHSFTPLVAPVHLTRHTAIWSITCKIFLLRFLAFESLLIFWFSFNIFLIIFTLLSWQCFCRVKSPRVIIKINSFFQKHILYLQLRFASMADNCDSYFFIFTFHYNFVIQIF